MMRTGLHRRLAAWVLAASTAVAAGAEPPKVGFAISIDSEGFVLNPVIRRVTVSKVAATSLADTAGIAVGDDILQVDGHPIVGQRGLALKPYLEFPVGQTRHLHLRHRDGTEFDADITKPAR